MDYRERLNDQEEMMRMHFESSQGELWTALPVVVNSYNAELQTCSLQPTVQCRQKKPDGSLGYITIPLLLDCPVLFPSGGGFTLTFPIAKGDEGLCVFSSRCIDGWWQAGGVQSPPEIRMHDLSDGFYIPGCRSKPNALSGVSATAAQLRSNDGSTFIQIAPDKSIVMTAPAGVTMNANLTVIGNMDIQGTGGEDTATIDCNLTQTPGKVLKAGNGATGTFSTVTVADGIVTGGS